VTSRGILGFIGPHFLG